MDLQPGPKIGSSRARVHGKLHHARHHARSLLAANTLARVGGLRVHGGSRRRVSRVSCDAASESASSQRLSRPPCDTRRVRPAPSLGPDLAKAASCRCAGGSGPAPAPETRACSACSMPVWCAVPVCNSSVPVCNSSVFGAVSVRLPRAHVCCTLRDVPSVGTSRLSAPSSNRPSIGASAP